MVKGEVEGTAIISILLNQNQLILISMIIYVNVYSGRDTTYRIRLFDNKTYASAKYFPLCCR